MNKNIIVSVVDGQGGGIGKQFIEKLRKEVPSVYIRALGTNSTATNKMVKAGANDGATGENAIVVNAYKSQIIVGVLGIVMPNSILGELTPKMAEAISSSEALKVLIPIQKCGVKVAFGEDVKPVSVYIDKAVQIVKNELVSNM